MEPSVNPAGWLLPFVHLGSVEIDGLHSCSAARAGEEGSEATGADVDRWAQV
jgi:hypothetical protein